MKKILFTALAVLSSIIVFSQNITVKDNLTKEPVEKVIISSKTKFVETDVKGNANISIFNENDTLMFNRYNYKKAALSISQLREMNFEILLKETSLDLNEIYISANKWEQESSEIPYLIENVSKKQIQFRNVQTSADLIGATGKIFVQKSQLGGGSPMIRGFAANRVLIVVDGVRMNNAIFRSGNLQNLISVDPEIIENSEVIFGPGSLIYGSDALGGVMDFHTKNPKFTYTNKFLFAGNALLRTSSANQEKTGHFDFNLGFKKITSLTSFSYSDFGDLKMGNIGNDEYIRPEYVDRINGHDSIIQNENTNIQKFSAYSQLNILQKIKIKITEKSILTYKFNYSNTSDIPRYDRLIQYKNGILRYGDWAYGPQYWMSNNLNLSVNSSSKAFDNVQITIAQQTFKESRYDRKIYDDIFFETSEKVDVYSLNVDFEKNINLKSTVFYGIESVYNYVNSVGNTRNIITEEMIPAAGRYPDGSVMATNSVFLGYKNNLSEKFTFTTGVRYSYSYLNAVFDNIYYSFPFDTITQKKDNITGSIGLVFRPTENWQINTHISSGFRSPNIDDIGKVFDSEPGNVIVPNPDLQPEYAYNYDLGIVKSFNEKLQIEITSFFNYLDNAILRGDFYVDGQDSILYQGELSKVEALVNNDYAYVYGFQTSFAYDISKHFELKGNFNKEFGKTKDGLPVRHVAPAFGGINFVFKSKKFKAEIYGIYNAEISFENLAADERDKAYMYATDENGNPYSPQWYTVNFRASYSVTKFLGLNAAVENITDQRYRPYSSGIVAPGRNFIISLRANF